MSNFPGQKRHGLPSAQGLLAFDRGGSGVELPMLTWSRVGFTRLAAD
jgi:hypothetical protein